MGARFALTFKLCKRVERALECYAIAEKLNNVIMRSIEKLQDVT